MKPYRTVAGASETETVIQKSRFIGRCYPVQAEEEAEAILGTLKKRHWDASHNCYAYRIGTGGEISRSSDDGEPSGTAGMPILNVLNAMELTNALCVVTRYFGGILLGAGGLVRAYSGAASESARLAGVVEMLPCLCAEMKVPYDLWAKLERLFREQAALERVDYGETVNILYSVPQLQSDALYRRLTDVSGGRIQPPQQPQLQYRSFPAGLSSRLSEGETR